MYSIEDYDEGYTVIDDALDHKVFEELQNVIPMIAWHFSPFVAFEEEEKKVLSGYWLHDLYLQDIPRSEYFETFMNPMIPLLKQNKYKTLLRARLICYTNTLEIEEHEPHVDFEYPHKGILLYLNDCDGFTRLHDGTKVHSKENRVLLHDAGLEHNSSTTTNVSRRMCLVINHL